MLKSLFKKTFDIRDGEIRISFFMQLYIFLLICVLLMVKPTINALFLSNLGASHLPYGYVLVAIIAVATSYFYNRAVKRFSLRLIAMSTLLFFSISFLVLSYLMHSSLLNDWVYYAYYLSVSLFAVLVTSQFWIIANMVYNAREAKRLFGFIGAGAIAGGIFGGYLTTLLASSFGNKYVMLVAAFLIICCIPILQSVWKLRITKLNRYIRNQRRQTRIETFETPFKLIVKSKHLTYLAAIVGVGVLMAKLVDFQFSDFANKAIPDSDDLASFFGFWFSTFNVIALLIQLFLTNRMLAWLGVTANLLILPLGIAFGCLLFLTFPELWVLILIKGMDGSFKQSINKAGIELSILPIPFHIKNQAKSYIDVVVDSVATGLAGLLLIFVIKKLDLNTSYITVIILLLLFIWMLLVYKLREAYFESFRTNIQQSLSISTEAKGKKSFEITVHASQQVFQNGTPQEIISLIDRLRDYRLKTFEPEILKLLDHPSNQVKAIAIEQLYYYKQGLALDKVKQLVDVKDDNLVYHAIEYLLHHTQLDDENIFRSYLDHEVDYISTAALLSLAKESSGNTSVGIKFGLNVRIEKMIRELSMANNDLRKQEIAKLLIAVAYANEPKYYSFISAHFNNRDSYVVKHAVKAAGITAHEPFVRQLIRFLSYAEYRKTAKKALRSYGVAITKTILKLDVSEEIENKVKPFIPAVIESFKSREAVKVLMRLLQSKDFTIRLAAATSLKKLKSKGYAISLDQRKLTKIILKEGVYYRNTINAIALQKSLIDHRLSGDDTLHFQEEGLDLQVSREGLIEILQIQLEQGLECVFKLLSLKYDQSDMDTAYLGLMSDVAETKINAVEFLDNLLKSRLKAAVLPLIEYHIIDSNDISEDSPTLDGPLLSDQQTLLMLLRNRGAKMKLAVLHVILETHDVSYLSGITSLLNHKNPKVRVLTRSIVNEFQSLPTPR